MFFSMSKPKKSERILSFCSKCFKLQGRLAQWGLKTKEKYKLEKPQQHLLLVKAVLYGEEIFLERAYCELTHIVPCCAIFP